ncbi:MAG: flagellar filament capping protein FliD [Bacillota bacterium]
MVLRIGGLASGMDIDSIVKELMRAERTPLDKIFREKQVLQWTREDYRSINTSLASLRDQVFNIKLQSSFLSKKAASSNEDAVKATASAGAVEGIYSVTVNNLAAGVFKGSTGELSDEYVDGSTTKTLFQQFETELTARGLTAADDITFTLNGNAFSFNLGIKNVNQVVSEINSADLGVKASYDTSLNRFFLTTTATGSDASMAVTADSANFLSTGVNSSILKLNLDTGTTYSGVDASIDFGDAAGLTFSSNTVTINGLTLDLKQGGATSTITVTNDTDTVYNTIKAFVDKYNEVVGKINTELREERDRDYQPLTDEEKLKMSDREIELWEEKARKGLLRNDGLLTSIVSKIRADSSDTVSGLSSYKNLAAIGITTQRYEYLGQLKIDETELRAALNDDLEGVMDLFTNNTGIDAEDGIAVRLYDEIASGIDLLSEKAGSDSSFSLVDQSFIGNRLTSLNRRIDQWEDKLDQIEDRYWRQFVAMEQALDQLNAQSSWLSQQLGTFNSK